MPQLSLVDRVGSRALGVFELAGAIATFGAHAVVEAARPPYELREIVRHAYQGWHDYLVAKGVECISRPERSPRGHSFFFVKDFDGNLIELMDLGYMYYVLGWLGPLGGWLFRRGMYKRYYGV